MACPRKREPECGSQTRVERQPLRLNVGDRKRVVVRFLKGLRPRERQLLALNFHERLGPDEIAGLTSLPPGEVRQTLRRLLVGVESALVAEDDALWRKFARRERSR
jgi:DNA-directed RNA polymerase specialized sigma24 family protein